MSIKIVVSTANSADPASEQTFTKDVISIGRTMGNDIVLPDVEKRVSSKHAKIEASGGAYQLSDVGSVNGTFLNGKKIDKNRPVTIKNGDRIGVGSFQLVFTTSTDNIETTKQHIDPTKAAERLTDQLAMEYAKTITRPPEERKAALREALREGLRVAGPDGGRAVLSLVRNRFRSAPSSTQAEGEQEVSRQEQLYRSGYQSISNLSTHFLGSANFESGDDVQRFVRLIEQALDVTLEWVANCLKGRREFENQFQADLTLVFAKEGNPLKSTSNTNEMARHLLDWHSSRDLAQPKGVLESAFKDLTMHQLGMLAGVQDCLKALLQKLDPKVMEQAVLNKGGLFVKMNLAEKAWKEYQTRHAEIFQENSKLFNELIYPNIRKGYLAAHATEATRPETPPGPPPPTKGDAK